uniref:competence protein CoiA family protein n=1 Tax=Belnapia moabensis TaxID=365533 RepID=UPI0012EEB74C|nr:competence protein CoiA family protein [Belnapia moabensis]
MASSGLPGTPECSPRGDGVLLPYGEASDGRLVRATEVPAGLECGCSCPACGAPLVARRGEMRVAHFAHATDRTCASAQETMLHKLAKQLIADGAPLMLPEVVAEYGGRRRLVRPAVTIRPEGAALEPGLDGLRPDILITVTGRPLLVEVAVTHFCGPEKLALIQERRLAAVEIDLSRVARDASPEMLEHAILRSAPRRWLWNRLAEATETAMRAEAARRACSREATLERLGNALIVAAASPTVEPADPRLTWAVEATRDAGLEGAVGIAVDGDGCFVVAREIWQSHLVGRHILGGIPLDERTAATSLYPVVRGRFAEPRPDGFEWQVITGRFPALRQPCDVVVDYLRLLGLMGLLVRDPGGLWRAGRAAVVARDRRQAATAHRIGHRKAPARNGGK